MLTFTVISGTSGVSSDAKCIADEPWLAISFKALQVKLKDRVSNAIIQE